MAVLWAWSALAFSGLDDQMFEVSWSEILILGVVTLLLVGPKELPRFLSSLGRHLGVIRKHANEFKAVFEQAMREAEMDSIKQEIRDIGDGVKKSFDDATRSVDSAKAAMRVDLNANTGVQPKPESLAKAEAKAAEAKAIADASAAEEPTEGQPDAVIPEREFGVPSSPVADEPVHAERPADAPKGSG
ncbi:preprotein translocase subunit TatA [Hyphomicrobium nitrativorans NL23]|uniref:Preprotein translocase subunit TatA n=2 Tax=Hyphomicrobium TaxID=81 RepID=V5SDH6_9HYPH|nr:preprotein translocase subunit TatA [Hyphomicrobium nitrativorans NL23]